MGFIVDLKTLKDYPKERACALQTSVILQLQKSAAVLLFSVKQTGNSEMIVMLDIHL